MVGTLSHVVVAVVHQNLQLAALVTLSFNVLFNAEEVWENGSLGEGTLSENCENKGQS